MKRILILTLIFEILIIAMTSILGAKERPLKANILSKEKVNYSTALKLYRNSEYSNAYVQFMNILSNQSEPLINDYVVYSGARSAMELYMYDEAIKLFTLLQNKYPTSTLYPYAEEYKALVLFYKNDYPVSNFFNGKTQNWIKEFVGVKAMSRSEDTNISQMIARELIDRFSNKDALIYYDKIFKTNAMNLSAEFKLKMARGLYILGYYRSSMDYYKVLENKNIYPEECEYYIARINQLIRNREEAAGYFDSYLSNANNKEYRKLAIYWSAENYNSMKKYDKSEELFLKFLKEYPKDEYAPRAYNRLTANYLRINDIYKAKLYVTKTLKNFPKSRFSETALKSYLRKSFKLKNKTETYFALEKLKDRYPSFRKDFALSWDMWIANDFYDTNKRNKAVMTTLLTSKNPHYIKGALSLAESYMVSNVALSNSYYFDEAERLYSNSKYSNAISMLNKVQFIDSIVTGEETPFLKEVRSLAKEIMFGQRFIKDFYSKKTEIELFNELSLQTRKVSDKAIALYYYGDLDNAYMELDKVIKKTKMSYPLFYFTQKIFVDSTNTKRFMQISANIGKYFAYPYSDNVELLPDELRRYVYPRYFDEYVVREANHYKIESSFVYAIMREESLFDYKATSSANAYGLMQLIAPTANMENVQSRYRFKPLNLKDPKQNIYLGISHLSRLFKGENASNYIIVAAKYNAGPGSGNRWKNEYGTNNMYYTARLVDYEETEYYIERVMKSYDYYKRFY